MRVSVLFFCIACFTTVRATQSLSDLQKQLHDAIAQSDAELEEQRVQFANKLLPTLLEDVIAKREKKCVPLDQTLRICTFCDWWNKEFEYVDCYRETTTNTAPGTMWGHVYTGNVCFERK